MLSNIIFNLRMKWIRQKGERYKREKRIKDAYAEYWPEKDKKKVSNVMLFVIVAAITSYTIASFWLAYERGISIDPTLTTCFYAFWATEVVALLGIKVSKVMKEHHNDCISSADNSQDDSAVG